MTISYNWLNEYLPETIEPEKLSKILTAVGLEVESLEYYESIKGSLKGLVIGEVLECEPHPNADKLKITKIDISNGSPLQIVCGASNVAVGQKVVVATTGSTIYPLDKEPFLIRSVKIRGTESDGMICAEDEIGINDNHDGIIVLPSDAKKGMPASEVYKIYTDWIYEIGLTPNRMDAMSHLGVAKDVCAYLSHHDRKKYRPKYPSANTFKTKPGTDPIKIVIENKEACQRYAGISIRGITIKQSPDWLQNRLKAIGARPVNNIVDITNFVLHEFGQPLHAFDEDEIKGRKVIVKNLPEGTIFKTLDEKERRLSSQDLMICNEEEGMCIGGIFGGIQSGIKTITKNIFLESAWFNPVTIRRSSLHHGLRTDAATRFEKGVDISNCVNALKRAAVMITEIAGGEIIGEIADVYPRPKDKVNVALKYHYLKKLSGKNYHPNSIKNILESLGFEVIKEGMDELLLAVPFSHTDVSLPADIVEEIIRIDGIDNIEIPVGITISPAVEDLILKEKLREKVSEFLAAKGFNEILTNSITNAAYYSEEALSGSVRMLNNLSAELNILRPSMLESGLESITYNLNRQNLNLNFFEFGKTYASHGENSYIEQERLALFVTGNMRTDSWSGKAVPWDFFTVKGLLEAILHLCGINGIQISDPVDEITGHKYHIRTKNRQLGFLQVLKSQYLVRFDIKQPLFYADFDFAEVIKQNERKEITYTEISKFPLVQRDLALIIDKAIFYKSIETAIKNINLKKLLNIKLFDLFQSDKIGKDKKSIAINFTFGDEEKTLTDKEIDDMMQKIMQVLAQELGAEIRK